MPTALCASYLCCTMSPTADETSCTDTTAVCCPNVTQVTEHASADSLEAPPSDGIYVSGLWIDGARWDTSAECLEESEPGVMYAPLPVIHFKPGKEAETSGNTPGQYSCPLYKTSVRAGVLSTTGQSTNFVLCVSLPVRKGTSSDFWVLQGVALLCMLDT